jgi:hypothetical protein
LFISLLIVLSSIIYYVYLFGMFILYTALHVLSNT